jgi:hypothetical protein
MPRLDLDVVSPEELLQTLSAIDITVPLRTEGRTSRHCERYTMARLLATLAETPELAFPLRLEHRDQPDFALSMPSGAIGVECTEAVSDEWAHIDAIRERDFPNRMIMVPMLRPGQHSFTGDERTSIAMGDRFGRPWVGKMAETQWAEAIAHFVGRKTRKLREGAYGALPECWLLIQDEWRVPLYRLKERIDAAELCVKRIHELLMKPAFTRIYVSNCQWLVRLAPGPVEAREVNNLWR